MCATCPIPTSTCGSAATSCARRDGRYELRVTNELEETLFVDRLQLLAVAHPASVEVYPERRDDRSAEGRSVCSPCADAVGRRRGVDDHGHDVTPRIAAIDRQYPDDFALEPIRGYAAPHALTLDLGRSADVPPTSCC